MKAPFLPPSARVIVLVAMVVVGLILFYEVARRGSPGRALAAEQFRRRILGGALLEIDLLLWLLADVVARHLSAAGQILYLLFATLFVLAPMVVAIRETGFILREYARRRSELVGSLGRRRRDWHENGHSGNG